MKGNLTYIHASRLQDSFVHICVKLTDSPFFRKFYKLHRQTYSLLVLATFLFLFLVSDDECSYYESSSEEECDIEETSDTVKHMANIEHVAQDADLTRKFHAVLSIRSVMAASSGVYFLPTTICPIDLTSDEKHTKPQ